jgi:signal transduction histidine kinase/ActR/RegA family two-component response regulator
VLGAFLGIVKEEERPALRAMLRRSMGAHFREGASETLRCVLAMPPSGMEYYSVEATRLTGGEVFITARSIDFEVRLAEELRGRLGQEVQALKRTELDNEYIRRLFSYVAHEYRNMYFAAHVSLEDCCAELEGTSTSQEIRQVLLLHDRMGQLFDDVLLMQKIDANKYVYPKVRYPLGPVLLDALLYAAPLTRNEGASSIALPNISHDVTLIDAVDPRVRGAVAFGSPSHLFQALTNLISNAFKYNVDGGSVTLRARAAPNDDAVVIEVIDTGIGISESNRAVIFKPYQRLATGSHRAGTGLGLAFSKDFVVKGNGATIEVLGNPDEPCGSCFRITLPVTGFGASRASESSESSTFTWDRLALVKEPIVVKPNFPPQPQLQPEQRQEQQLRVQQTQAMPARPPAPPSSLADDREFEVLVVDDDDIVRTMLTRRLRKFEFEGRPLRVTEAACGEDALQLALEKRQRFRLVTMDQDMGANRYSGAETIKLLRDGGFTNTVVGLTACEQQSEMDNMRNCGADDVLLKGPRVFEGVYAILSKIAAQADSQPQARVNAPTLRLRTP